VNIGSIDGMHGMNSIAVYSASKWGVRGLDRVAAIELGRFAIRVNTDQPVAGSPEMFAPFSPRFDWERYQRTCPSAEALSRRRAVRRHHVRHREDGAVLVVG
jgi:NAD(P)-dependent dehydrogenase (short-subunit alcohol dehydrogenase family)